MPRALKSDDIEKAYGQAPHEKLWGVLWDYTVDGCLFVPSRHCIPAQKFVSRLSLELNHNCSPLL